ncbi:MAG: hypothetical protein KC931_15605, partial [Candidatus Omnitrophica bacterium]|nr:hypothetical protein [Candidatus Omnitrophota bacterium]
MEFGKRILKGAVLRDSIRVEDPVEVQKRREAECEDLIRQARMKSERMMADAFESIRKERE